MGQPDHLEVCGRRGFFRPVGVMSLDEATAHIDALLRHAREAGLEQLLVDIRALTGYPVPSLVERYLITTRWAGTAAGALAVAMLVRPELIDPGKFGVLVARNRGLHCDVFARECEALGWLDGQQ